MKKKYKISFLILFSFLIILLAFIYLASNNIEVLNPKGMIAQKEKDLMILCTLLMLIVVIPVFVLTFFFAWRYRSTNTKAKYSPDWDSSHIAEVIWWGFPFVIIVLLSVVTWKSCHELDPFKPLTISSDPVRIQVVALRWKWLFIYPEQKIAVVNFMQIPKNIPINFEVTADAPMNSFWIPQLGGQIYAMPGMRTKLHLIANDTGNFRGSSANLSGEGFSKMTFIAKSSSQQEFDDWVKAVKKTGKTLNEEEYSKLVEPTDGYPVESYVLKNEDLFDQIVMKYMMPMNQ